MYASFFGLERMPFNGLSSSDELFLHASFRHAGEQLRDGIKRGTRLLLLTAERGTGKTVLLKMLDERLERDGFKVCSLAASVGMGELRNARDSAKAFEGAPQASAGSPHPSIGTILASATSEAPVVVLVDDADLLNNEVLQSLVDLAGSDSTLQGSLRIVLAGTPNLSSRLHAAGASALLEKGQAQAFLAPLSEHEVGEYVAHKLQAAGSNFRFRTV